ncbi:hypothetical protein GCM10010371_23390 [Streptomyces subrutilus]|uniref:Tat (Twin-arginine translocation) pathway signal sequence n=1 Tax=Streptomyces subrutilus TaxID=36818 RepID=A0A918QPD6_9ACTN|nr:hypothetical protein [Streptomyces subrutilus]GGZ63171.1 hypothetical protein GCM10010371_23390 [Streptomyces subrutilus]
MPTTPRSARPHGPSRPALPRPGAPGRAYAALAALAVVLAAAFVGAPGPLAARLSGGGFGDRRGLVESLSAAFVGYWNSGDRAFTPGLERVVAYWTHYHVVKAVAAALLLIVLGTLGVLLWKAFLRAGSGAGRRAALASAGSVVTALALFSLVTVLANVQGAAAPFSSLLPVLPLRTADGELAAVLAQTGQHLAALPRAGDPGPAAVEVMVGDFARYHAVLAVAAATVAVVLLGLAVVAWRRGPGAAAGDRRTRRVLRSFAVLAALVAAAFAVVAVANATTTADPAPALLAFFDGGW